MSDELKTCIGCSRALPMDQFARKSNPNKCRECLNAYNREYYHGNTDAALQRSRSYRATVEGRAKMIMSQVRHRSKKARHTVTVSETVIVNKLRNGMCEGSGLPLNLANIQRHWDNPLGPSLDRIESADGYTDDNIQLVCNMYNRGKNKHDELDFIAMCCAVADKHGHRHDVIERLYEMRTPR